MSQITLRNIDPELLKKIKEMAQKENTSMDKLITRILKQAVQSGKKKAIPGQNRYDDLDELFGVWSDEEAKTFEEALKLQRKVDEELWS